MYGLSGLLDSFKYVLNLIHPSLIYKYLTAIFWEVSVESIDFFLTLAIYYFADFDFERALERSSMNETTQIDFRNN